MTAQMPRDGLQGDFEEAGPPAATRAPIARAEMQRWAGPSTSLRTPSGACDFERAVALHPKAPWR